MGAYFSLFVSLKERSIILKETERLLHRTEACTHIQTEEDVCNSILLNLPEIFNQLDKGYINGMRIVSLRELTGLLCTSLIQ